MKKVLVVLLAALAIILPASFSATVTLSPNMDGFYTQWTSAGNCAGFTCVNNWIPGNYVKAPAPDMLQSSYGFPDLVPVPGTTVHQINSVRIFYLAYRTTLNAPCMIPFIRFGSFDYYTFETCPSTLGWGTIPRTFSYNPKTGLRWTLDEVNALEAGMVSVDGIDGEAQVAQIYTQVTYS